MLKISNTRVYNLKESVIACRNAMRTTPPEYTEEEFEESLERAKALANSPDGSGHQNFLKGIRVSFDVTYPQYWSMEFQRYAFADIVTSSSKMHRLAKMDIAKACNVYVTHDTIIQMHELIEKYNRALQIGDPDEIYIAFMMMISNCPMGLELFMRVSTNYAQLKTIYHQRRNHKLKEDWGAFCQFIESLPYAKEFITGE